MRITVLCLIIFFTTTLSGCGKTLFTNIRKGRPPPQAPAHPGMLAASPAKSPSGDLYQNLRKSIAKFTSQNLGKIYAVLALAFLWVFSRAYYFERTRKRLKLDTEDLGLMKIIRDSAARVWRKHRPGRNVVRLDDWRE